MLTAAAAVAATLTTTALASSSGPPTPREPTLRDFERCLAALRDALPAECVDEDEEALKAHGLGQWSEVPATALPGVVVYPRDTADVVAIVRLAARHRIPIVPYGAGTSIEGQINAPCTPVTRKGKARAVDEPFPEPGLSISLDLGAHMNEVVAVHDADLQVTVQAGMPYDALNAALADRGLFFAVDPGGGATIGGMAATGASGTIMLGTMREATLNLTVVLPSGEVIRTRSRAAKSSAGPDLTKLFVGSEGTLGVVVEATLKLQPVLPTSVTRLTFASVRDAAATVAAMQAAGVDGLQCAELLDARLVRALNADDSNGLPPLEERPTLLIKVRGSEARQRRAQQDRVAVLARRHGCLAVQSARDGDESETLWRARKQALNSALAMAPGATFHSTDACVPMSNLPAFIEALEIDLASERYAYAGIVAHVGSANVHTIICCRGEEQERAATAFADRMARRAIALDGTCTGEHGVGSGKQHFLRDELGGSLDLLRAIKQTVDPLNIMNPSALIPP